MGFSKQIYIGDKMIGGDHTFIIAELGSNHNQDIHTAFELIDAAVESGADAVKFQSIKGENIFRVDDLNYDEKELLRKIELKESWYERIQDYCLKKEILWFSAATYLDAVDLLVDRGVKLMKIASPQTYGFPQLIRKVGETGLPTIMSSGYCSLKDVERAVDIFQKTGNKDLILLHCISNYPTAYESVYLNSMETLKTVLGTIVGFSDHTLGWHIAIAAVAKGAKVIEKHLTLSRRMEGPDHYFAVEPKEFKKMILSIRDVEKSFGTEGFREVTTFEEEYRNQVEMKLFASENIKKDEKLEREKLMYFRSKEKDAVSAWDEDAIVHKKAKENIDKYDAIKKGDLY